LTSTATSGNPVKPKEPPNGAFAAGIICLGGLLHCSIRLFTGKTPFPRLTYGKTYKLKKALMTLAVEKYASAVYFIAAFGFSPGKRLFPA
jgi:hypothetical protein